MVAGGFTALEYDSIRAGCQQSAEVIVPMALRELPPVTRVVDVGCGEGWFAKEFQECCGATVWGIESERPVTSCIPCIITRDLSAPLSLLDLPRADLVVCLEVAEHLPAVRGPSFVAELCDLAPIVLWSAAIPGQGGHLHVNERWQSYWVGEFVKQGFGLLRDVRPEIWSNDCVEPWYRQNLLLFTHFSKGGELSSSRMLDIVHPEIFGWRVLEARR